ncbi:MAG TPA: GNAT family N-acetyltransferase [Terriglobales bacterium]
MNLRPAEVADIPAIIALERAAVFAAHWSEQSYRAAFEANAAPRIVLVIDNGQGQGQRQEKRNSLQGFLFARINGLDSEGAGCEIENIVVAAGRQRRGFGKMLLQALIAAAGAHKAKSIFLEVRESNAAARALYENCGFSITGRRKSYYKDPPEDALHYTLAL